jgi:hypothetical protein
MAVNGYLIVCPQHHSVFEKVRTVDQLLLRSDRPGGRNTLFSSILAALAGGASLSLVTGIKSLID